MITLSNHLYQTVQSIKEEYLMEQVKNNYLKQLALI